MDFFQNGMFLVLAVIIMEIILSTKWSKFYFKNGIKIYGREFRYNEKLKDINNILSKLNNSFKSTGYSPAIIFNEIDENTIGFREKMFDFSLFNYTPIMHGKIEKNDIAVQITGMANWFPIGFLVLWYSPFLRRIDLSMDLPFLVGPFLIFGAIYAMQSKRYNKIFQQLTEIIE